MGKICAFFGHREIYQDISPQLTEAVLSAIQQGYDIFWCGGYGAFDINAVGVINRLKKVAPELQAVLILAYLPNGPLLDVYDYSILPEGVELGPPRFAISRRNEWIIHNCDGSICYVNRPYGGAYTAYKKLQRKKKVLTNLGSFPSTP